MDYELNAILKPLALVTVLILAASPAAAQTPFDLQLDHTTLLVRDLEASARFYEDVLQLPSLETPWGPAAPVRFFSLGGSRQLHVGVTDRAAAPGKASHLAFAVRDFDGYLRFLRERGIAYGDFRGTIGEVHTRPDGVRQVYLQDPEGHWIEINDAEHPVEAANRE